jgi:hypothetical protein
MRHFFCGWVSGGPPPVRQPRSSDTVDPRMDRDFPAAPGREPCRVQTSWPPGYRRRQSKQSGSETTAPRRKAHLPPAHPQQESVERNGHFFMALTKASDSETSGRSRPCAGAGSATIVAPAIVERAQMCRILISSGESSAAHVQRIGQPRQTAGQGQFGHGSDFMAGFRAETLRKWLVIRECGLICLFGWLVRQGERHPHPTQL